MPEPDGLTFKRGSKADYESYRERMREVALKGMKNAIQDALGPRIMLSRPPMTRYQHEVLDSPKRFLWIGAGTKSGKTVVCAQWIIERLAEGRRCAWVGPVYKRSLTGFEYVAKGLNGLVTKGLAKVSWGGSPYIDVPCTGGKLVLFTGENPQAIYGDAFDAVVIDEGTRQPEAVWNAVRTTVTATRGKVRIAFNTDQPPKQWAVREFLRAKTGEEPSYGYMNLPTADSPFVPLEEVEQARRTLPDRVFAALYLAQVQDDGANVFGHHRDCINGDGFLGLSSDDTYICGLDVARKQDWTVLTVFSRKRKTLVYADRFWGLPWTAQVDRVMGTVRRYRNAQIICDATGVGDVVVELLEKKGAAVTPVVLTQQSKSTYIERLMVAFQNREVTYPECKETQSLMHELDNFEFKVSPGGGLQYAAADGYHDDFVLSFALGAYHLVGMAGAAFTSTKSFYSPELPASHLLSL